MKTTLSIIKADIGSIGGHIKPSARLGQRVEEYLKANVKGLASDFFVSHARDDDVATLFNHTGGVGNDKICKLASDAFIAGTTVVKEQGLYGAGQDLLKDSFSGNVRGVGPVVAEMESEERPNEPFLFFAADKTDPGAYNLPLCLMFADPMYNSSFIMSPNMAKSFKFVIMDVSHAEGDRLIDLNAPEKLYDIAALVRDNERFVLKSVWFRETGDDLSKPFGIYLTPPKSFLGESRLVLLKVVLLYQVAHKDVSVFNPKRPEVLTEEVPNPERAMLIFRRYTILS